MAMRTATMGALLGLVLLNAGCATTGQALGEWLARAQQMGAVGCAAQPDPQTYARCMGAVGADAAILTAAGRLRDAVRKAMRVAAPGGAELGPGEARQAARELRNAIKEWER